VEEDRKRRIRGRALAHGLQAIRAERGGTQAAEAVLAGVSLRTWRRWERVETQAPAAKLEGAAARWRVLLEDVLAEPTRERLAELRLEQELQRFVDEHGIDRVRTVAERVGILVRA
jgi:transcriptional regulator with XRE-family HTH domain